MAHNLSKQEKKAYRQVLADEVTLVGWGFRPYHSLYAWAQRLPLSHYIDSNQALWGKTKGGPDVRSPEALKQEKEKIALVNFYFSDDVAKAASACKITALPPLPIQHLAHDLNTTGTTPSLNNKDVQEIIEKLTPVICSNRRISSKIMEWISRYNWKDFLSTALPLVPKHISSGNTVLLTCNSLALGGAERQIVACACGFQNEGWKTTFLASMNKTTTPHYLHTLNDHKIAVFYGDDEARTLSPQNIKALVQRLHPAAAAALWHLPISILGQVAAALLVIEKVRPSLIIAYLDWSSLIGGFAGLLAGVPNIVLSGRGHAPDTFPHFFKKHLGTFHDLYQILLKCPNVHFTNNALNARNDYARWLDIKAEKIHYIPNALTPSFLEISTKKEQSEFRDLHSIPKDVPLVLTITRLDHDKHPDKFLEILRRVRKRIPAAHGIICGDGPMMHELKTAARRSGLINHITFLGNIPDVRPVMGLCDLLVHVCPNEGMPNAILEAQSQKLPVVSMKSGGVEECLAPDLRKFCCLQYDWGEMAEAVITLLNNPALRNNLGTKGRAYVVKNFTISKLVARNLKLLTKQRNRK